MSKFKVEKAEDFGSIQAKLYSYTEQKGELATYIRKKIASSQQDFENLLANHTSDDVDKTALLAKFKQLATAANHSIPAFDVKRSAVTEFMAEFLLENEFQCIFFEQANKKLTKSVVDANRHTPGIDVVGIQENDKNLKFIVAEVKASKDQNIPSSSAQSLKKDIENICDFDNNRLTKEITAMFQQLGQKQPTDKYITFLLELINGKNSAKILVEKIIIFPFLIRNNPKILQEKNLNDFKNFSELDTKGIETVGVVWAINKNIDEFVKNIYAND